MQAEAEIRLEFKTITYKSVVWAYIFWYKKEAQKGIFLLFDLKTPAIFSLLYSYLIFLDSLFSLLLSTLT